METEDIIEAPLAEGAVAFMLRCHAGDEHWEIPEWAVLTLTPQRARSLLRLCETVRKLGVYKIADFDLIAGFLAGVEWVNDSAVSVVDLDYRGPTAFVVRRRHLQYLRDLPRRLRPPDVGEAVDLPGGPECRRPRAGHNGCEDPGVPTHTHSTSAPEGA